MSQYTLQQPALCQHPARGVRAHCGGVLPLQSLIEGAGPVRNGVERGSARPSDGNAPASSMRPPASRAGLPCLLLPCAARLRLRPGAQRDPYASGP